MLEYFVKIMLLSFALQGADVPTAAKTATAEHELLQQVNEANRAERWLADMAIVRGTSRAVIGFAQHASEDHAKAGNTLNELAGPGHAMRPAMPRPDQRKLRQHLSGLSGPAFDRAYLNAIIRGHDKTARTLDRLSRTATDEDLRDYARRALTMVRQHQARARDIRQRLSNTAPRLN